MKSKVFKAKNKLTERQRDEGKVICPVCGGANLPEAKCWNCGNDPKKNTVLKLGSKMKMIPMDEEPSNIFDRIKAKYPQYVSGDDEGLSDNDFVMMVLDRMYDDKGGD